jgi:hypothetical protein
VTNCGCDQKIIISYGALITLVCFISFFTPTLHAQDVIVAIGDSSGYPGLPSVANKGNNEQSL